MAVAKLKKQKEEEEAKQKAKEEREVNLFLLSSEHSLAPLGAVLTTLFSGGNPLSRLGHGVQEKTCPTFVFLAITL